MTDAELEQLRKDVDQLKATFAAFSLSDRYMLAKNIQVQDGRSFSFGGTLGSRIGTSPDQKLAFFGASPVSRQAAITAPSGGATQDTQARVAIIAITSVLHAFGLTA